MSEIDQSPQPRPMCKNCGRPQSHCLCAFIKPHFSRYHVVILQDPKEARHAMSTAPLLAKSLSGSRLVVGEVFQPVVLLGENWRDRAVLLFPGGEDCQAETWSRSVDTLVILDGTWRKVSRLIHLNPWLNHLPRLSLSPASASRYRIRKSPRSDGLSTIEATVMALNYLQPEQCYDDILRVFDEMVAMQLREIDPVLVATRYSQS